MEPEVDQSTEATGGSLGRQAIAAVDAEEARATPSGKKQPSTASKILRAAETTATQQQQQTAQQSGFDESLFEVPKDEDSDDIARTGWQQQVDKLEKGEVEGEGEEEGGRANKRIQTLINRSKELSAKTQQY
jgi:hypothetical protein